MPARPRRNAYRSPSVSPSPLPRYLRIHCNSYW